MLQTDSSFEDTILNLQEKLHSPTDWIPIDEIPLVLQQDLESFMIGKTYSTFKGKVSISRLDYYYWYKKIMLHGVDYPIQFETKN